MAALGTDTQSVGTISTFSVLQNAIARNTDGVGTIGLFNPFPQVGTVTSSYAQRVFSSGLGVWCYYVQASINPTPATTDTTPNWTGSITAFEVLAKLS